MILLFTFTAFLSAALLFVLQPITGKMILPVLGGAPAVWNACLVFFQTGLLLGYLYAHLLTRWLAPRRQALIHAGVLLIPFAVLPVILPARVVDAVPFDHSPLPWLFGFLATGVALPFFAVASTAPLLQKWFANTNHPRAGDPYFLYAASNAGSVIGLLSYPVLIEPLLPLKRQNELWTLGYGALVAGLLVCAFMVRSKSISAPARTDTAATPAWPRRLRWILLAAIPTSLMMGVTTYLTTDVSPIPLFWVVPLLLYLTTFIFVFARRPILAPAWAGRALCLPALVLVIAFIVQATHPPWLLVPLHLIVFFTAALICHSELAKDRPDVTHLTEFYLCLSFGGALGGVFNALLAPHIFTNVWEYPLAMILACAIRPGAKFEWQASLKWAGIVFAVTAVSIVAAQRLNLSSVLIFGLPALLVYRAVAKPVRFGLAMIAMLAGAAWYIPAQGRTLRAERNFFGVLRVTVDATGNYHQLLHGNTIHGRQSLDARTAREPLVYYHRHGPLGQIIETYNAGPSSRSVAVIGLGAGSMASYASTNQDWTFYEINPAVETIARDPKSFTFLAQATGPCHVLLGDARLRLREASDHHFGLIVLDAFSSDSIPMHLLTREAMQLYLGKLSDHGLLAFHITNRRLELLPVVANLANDAGLAALVRTDALSTPDGREPSRWVALARRDEDLAALAASPGWERVVPAPQFGVWRDDFSNILSVLKWR